MLVSTAKIFEKCYGKYAIAAVNVWNMEMLLGLFQAAEKANAPFIVQLSPAAIRYANSEMLISMIRAAARIHSKAVFAIHLDHGNLPHALACIETGNYNSVMIDASHENFEDSIKITRNVVDQAHQKNIAVEAEMGKLDFDGGTEAEDAGKFATQIAEFVEQSKCDSLAVPLGASHGVYKLKGTKSLRMDLLNQIQKQLPQFPLVLHGGSSVSKEEIQRINIAGGQLGVDAKGISSKQVIKSIGLGVCKVNIASDIRLIWTRVNREFFKYSPAKFDPIIPGEKYMKEMEAFCLDKFELLKSVGKADELKL